MLNSISAVLALILAFSFASGLTHHKAHRGAVVAEANALGTAYLRSKLVGEPGRTELQEALLDYAQARVVEVGTNLSSEELGELVEGSWNAKAKLWPAVERVVREVNDGPIEAALVVAVNEVLDADTKRLAAIYDTLPAVVLVLLLFIAATTVAVAGFNAGILGRISRWRTTILVLVLAGIMVVILDFDRPRSGFIRVSQGSLRAAIAEMEDDFKP